MVTRFTCAGKVPLRVTEYAQSIGVPKSKMHELIDIVYARLHGEPHLEMGGIAMTFTVLCGVQGKDMG